jgi:hypothetical protein
VEVRNGVPPLTGFPTGGILARTRAGADLAPIVADRVGSARRHISPVPPETGRTKGDYPVNLDELRSNGAIILAESDETRMMTLRIL